MTPIEVGIAGLLFTVIMSLAGLLWRFSSVATRLELSVGNLEKRSDVHTAADSAAVIHLHNLELRLLKLEEHRKRHQVHSNPDLED